MQSYRIQTKIPKFQLAHLGSVEESASLFTVRKITLEELTFIPLAVRTTFV
jgi:hypothetical protein